MALFKTVRRRCLGIGVVMLSMVCFGSLATLLADRKQHQANKYASLSGITQAKKYASLSGIIQQLARTSRHAFTPSSEVVRLIQLHQLKQLNPVDANDVVFIVMASAAEKQRVAYQRASWMRWAKNIYIFADEADARLGIRTLPAIHNKTGFAEAQFRQLHGMKWILLERPDIAAKRWFFLVDDDTWVNVPVLLSYLSQFPPILPLSFSHMYIMYDKQAVYNGGAGMLFTRTAFEILGSSVLTDACSLTAVDPGFVNNDNILAACAFSTGVLKVSSSKFSTYEGVLHLENEIVDTGWLDQITVHKIRDKALAVKMFCWSESLRGRPLDRECQSALSDYM